MIESEKLMPEQLIFFWGFRKGKNTEPHKLFTERDRQFGMIRLYLMRSRENHPKNVSLQQ